MVSAQQVNPLLSNLFAYFEQALKAVINGIPTFNKQFIGFPRKQNL